MSNIEITVPQDLEFGPGMMCLVDQYMVATTSEDGQTLGDIIDAISTTMIFILGKCATKGEDEVNNGKTAEELFQSSIHKAVMHMIKAARSPDRVIADVRSMEDE